MNKLNPLYLLAALVFLLLFVVYRAGSMQAERIALEKEMAVSEKLGKTIVNLKTLWKDEKAMQERIDKVLRLKGLKENLLSHEVKKGVYTVVLQNLSKRDVDTFSGKILNQAVIVKSIEFIRHSEHNVSVTMECAL